jgi:structural maintenance of chromosome 4
LKSLTAEVLTFPTFCVRTIRPFQSFTAIVGPNGSGKSNVIDALLFVFGNRASKLRQGKLGELVHNSKKFPDLEECSVEVHFQLIKDLVRSRSRVVDVQNAKRKKKVCLTLPRAQFHHPPCFPCCLH